MAPSVYRRARRAGMTLLELLLALSLSALLMIAVGMAIDLHLRALDTQRTNVEEAQLARAVLRRVDDDLRGAMQYEIVEFSIVEQLAAGAAVNQAANLLSGAADPSGINLPGTGTQGTAPQGTGQSSTGQSGTAQSGTAQSGTRGGQRGGGAQSGGGQRGAGGGRQGGSAQGTGGTTGSTGSAAGGGSMAGAGGAARAGAGGNTASQGSAGAAGGARSTLGGSGGLGSQGSGARGATGLSTSGSTASMQSGPRSTMQGSAGVGASGLAVRGADGQTTSGAASEDVSGGMGAASLPGLYGNQFELQIDVSRLPRLDEYSGLADLSPDGQFSATKIPSDVKTIAYYLKTQDESMGLGGTSLIARPRTGLVRRELDRAVTSWASASGVADELVASERVLAPEVTSLEFQYFDGQFWNTSWDSDVMGGLPVAIEILIGIASHKSREAQRQQAAAGAVSYAPSEDDLLYRLVVRIPVARPTSQAEGALDPLVP